MSIVHPPTATRTVQLRCQASRTPTHQQNTPDVFSLSHRFRHLLPRYHCSLFCKSSEFFRDLDLLSLRVIMRKINCEMRNQVLSAHLICFNLNQEIIFSNKIFFTPSSGLIRFDLCLAPERDLGWLHFRRWHAFGRTNSFIKKLF